MLRLRRRRGCGFGVKACTIGHHTFVISILSLRQKSDIYDLEFSPAYLTRPTGCPRYPELDVTEEQCLEQCLNLSTCTAAMLAPMTTESQVAGECWLSNYTNPNQTQPGDPMWQHPTLAEDELWLLENVMYEAPKALDAFCVDEMPVIPNQTMDQTRYVWQDAFNRTCDVYRKLRLCSTTGVNVTWPAGHPRGPAPNTTWVFDNSTIGTNLSINGSGWIRNVTYGEPVQEFMPFYGTEWDFFNYDGQGGMSFEVVRRGGLGEGHGMFEAASSACCGCGRKAQAPEFRVYVRRHTAITLFPESVSDLVCSPDQHHEKVGAIGGSVCVEPMELTALPNVTHNVTKCCFKKSSHVPTVLEGLSADAKASGTCTASWCGSSSLPMPIVDYNFSVSVTNSTANSSRTWPGYVLADARLLRDKNAAGKLGVTVRLASTLLSAMGGIGRQGAALETVVEGRLHSIHIKSRGTGYTAVPHVLLWPLKRAENHNESLRAAERQQYFTKRIADPQVCTVLAKQQTKDRAKSKRPY